MTIERPPPLTAGLPRAALAFAAGISASFVFISIHSTIPPADDAIEYYRIAQNLAEGNGFSFDGVKPYTYRPPLFSLLLGLWFRLAGTSTVSAAAYQATMHGLSAAAAFLLFRALRCPPGWALFLSFAVALQPTLVSRAAFVLQEPTLLFFTTVALLCTAVWLDEPSRGRACLAGLSWGVASLGKAVALIALPLVVGYWLVTAGARKKEAFIQAALFAVLFSAVIAPWTIRNYLVMNRVVPINDQGFGMLEWNVLMSSPPGAQAGKEYIEDLDRRGIKGEERKELLWRYIKDNPRYFIIERVYRNAASFASPAREWWWVRGRFGPGEKRPLLWTIHDYFHRFLFLLLLFRGIQALRGRLSVSAGFIALFCIAYWAQYAALVGGPRFGVPVYPALLSLLIPSGTKVSAGRNEGFHFRSYTFRMGGRP